MLYTLKSGTLYLEPEQKPLMKIKSSLVGSTTSICKVDATELLTTDICYPDPQKAHSGDARDKEYTLTDHDGNMVGKARPGYASVDDPDMVGWPICRMPGADRACVVINETTYLLIMHNNQNYGMQDSDGKEVLRIMHKGISGGWSIECDCGLAPEVICGLFVFCRYIEQENEFLVV